MAAQSALSWTLFALGYPEQAQVRSREALDAARELAHPNTLAYALLFACFFEQFVERHEAQDRAEALVELSTEHGFSAFPRSGDDDPGVVSDSVGGAGERVGAASAGPSGLARHRSRAL